MLHAIPRQKRGSLEARNRQCGARQNTFESVPSPAKEINLVSRRRDRQRYQPPAHTSRIESSCHNQSTGSEAARVATSLSAIPAGATAASSWSSSRRRCRTGTAHRTRGCAARRSSTLRASSQPRLHCRRGKAATVVVGAPEHVQARAQRGEAEAASWRRPRARLGCGRRDELCPGELPDVEAVQVVEAAWGTRGE